MGCYYSTHVWHSFDLHKVFTMHKNGGSGIVEKQPWAGAFITNVGFVFLPLSLYKHKSLQGPNTNTLHYGKKNKPIDRKCFVLQTNQPKVMDWNIFENVTSNVVWSIPLRKQFIKIEESRKETCKFLDIPGFTKPHNFKTMSYFCAYVFYVPRGGMQQSVYSNPRNLWFQSEHKTAFFCFLIILQANFWG